MEAKVVRVDVLIMGERNFPVAQTKLPVTVVADLPLLLEAAKRANPSMTYEEIVRAIWRYGTKQLRSNLATGKPIPSTQNLPALVLPVKAKAA